MGAGKQVTAKSIVMLSLVFLVLLALCGPLVAASKLVVHVNKGIGGAKLGMKEKDAVKAIGLKPSRTGKDSEYEGRVVYYDKFGKANKNSEYPLEVYCDTNRKAFMFVVNSSAYPTDESVKVGSSEDSLKKAYGRKLKSRKSRVYTRYWLGDKTGTDFYVKSSKVTQIIVHSY